MKAKRLLKSLLNKCPFCGSRIIEKIKAHYINENGIDEINIDKRKCLVCYLEFDETENTNNKKEGAMQ